MLQFLKNPSFDFMKRGNLLLGISGALMLVAVIIVAVNGLNLGIEFTGGTEIQIKYVETPDVAGIRSALNAAGLTNNVVTTIGDKSANEVYIRVGDTDEEEEEEADAAVVTARIISALRDRDGAANGRDLNVVDQAQLEILLRDSPASEEQAIALAEVISEQRKEAAIFHSVEELVGLEGMTPEVLEYLRAHAIVGPFALRSQSFIGPAIGRELFTKALLAIVGSLIGMLIYIWVRFQLVWGFAAVAALAHDTLICLGLFSLFGMEMSLSVVAAFLTLVGYSVNDTVVVFDRVRENLHNRSANTFEGTVNLSINQTLSRTIITSGLTFVVVFGLYLFGGAALNSFAFVLSTGVIVGTYSSIYIASPILVIGERYFRQRKAGGGSKESAPPGGGARRARKLPTSQAGSV